MSYRPTTVFVIREKATGKLVKFGAKCGWATIGAAKNAFSLYMHYRYRDYLQDGKNLYDTQDDFIIEEVK